MLRALILICTTATAPSNCTVTTSIYHEYGDFTAPTPTACLAEGQRHIANFNPLDHTIYPKVICEKVQ